MGDSARDSNQVIMQVPAVGGVTRADGSHAGQVSMGSTPVRSHAGQVSGSGDWGQTGVEAAGCMERRGEQAMKPLGENGVEAAGCMKGKGERLVQ